MPKEASKKPIKSRIQRVRLTGKEDENFEKYSKKVGVDRSKIQRKIIRELINNELDLVPEEIERFHEASKQVAALGRNFNQLMRAINSGKVPDRAYHESYYRDIRDSLSYLSTTLKTYLDHTETRWVKVLEADNE